ncbi:VanZ family protein [Adlercreutzia murintestinalis]|uniref:VanZ family protein n=1 Tax=Adlercreutzia murintestinalis TaxID=2941325 RepID=UPI00203B3169|nr:VanZ family protein [Adlercreutzia murintestinalis]
MPDRSGARLAISWALVVGWACFIFFMSAHTGADLDEGAGVVAQVKQWLNAVQLRLFGPGVDVVSSLAHFCEYAVLGALLANAVRLQGERAQLKDRRERLEGQGARRTVVVVVGAVVIASVYGATDEIHQLFVPDRMCDAADWLVDTVGAALGAVVAALLSRRSSGAAISEGL